MRNDQKRILIISERFPPVHSGGAERIAFLSAKGLQNRGWNVHVATFMTDVGSAYHVDGISVRSFHRAAYPFYWRTYRNMISHQSRRSLRRFIGGYDPGHVLIHNPHQFFSQSEWGHLLLSRRVAVTLHDAMLLAMSKIQLFYQIRADAKFLQKLLS